MARQVLFKCMVARQEKEDDVLFHELVASVYSSTPDDNMTCQEHMLANYV